MTSHDEVRARVRQYGDNVHGLIGYVTGLLGSGNCPHDATSAAIALAEHKAMTMEKVK